MCIVSIFPLFLFPLLTLSSLVYTPASPPTPESIRGNLEDLHNVVKSKGCASFTWPSSGFFFFSWHVTSQKYLTQSNTLHSFSFSFFLNWGIVGLRFPGGGSCKAPASWGRRPRPWIRKIPGGDDGKPLQCSCLENPVDRGAWGGCSPWGHKEPDVTEETSHARMHTWFTTLC